MSTALAPVRALTQVLAGLTQLPCEVEVCDITADSREVTDGAAFLACRGRTHHGLEFAQRAAAAGARAILWEPAPDVTPPVLDSSIALCPVPRLSAHLGLIADRFFDAPSAHLTVIGITGTNGKTTCAWLLAQALARLQRPAGYLGTLGAGVPGALQPLTHTTPDAITLHRALAAFRAQGLDCAAIEVSSHALDQERCAALRLHAAVFTNLTRDHLDYHPDMAAYAAAKAKLFAWPALAARVLNIDDDFGAELARRWSREGGARLYLTAREQRARARASGADYVCASAVSATAAGLSLELETSHGRAQLQSALRGEFNADNLLSVLGTLLALEVPLARACMALAACSAPPGRMQPEGGGALPLVLIDYAHTPDALAKALAAARAHCRGRLWGVFGCGGDRDAGKRAQMGRVAASLCDELIVTDDNPRTEDPRHIVAEILTGIPAALDDGHVRVIHDRAAAIAEALRFAREGDVVLIAGKGHEEQQIVGCERRAFSDAAVARRALAAWSAA